MMTTPAWYVFGAAILKGFHAIFSEGLALLTKMFSARTCYL